MKWKPSWVTNMLRASLSKSITGNFLSAQKWRRLALVVILSSAASCPGQASSETATSGSQNAAGTAAVSAEASPAKPPAAPPQQRVASYDRHIAPAIGQVPVKDSESPGTLHVLVGRSLFINSPQRLRKVYVSNGTVLDSLTASPNQVVITGKAAGTGSVVLWDETGQSELYTVLVDLDVSALQASLNRALPGDHVEATAIEGRVYLSGVVGSDGEVSEALTLAGNYSKEVVNALLVDPRHVRQVELRVRIAELDRTKLSQFGFNFLSTGKNTAAITTEGSSPPIFSQIGGSGTQALVQDVLNLFYFNTDLNLGATIRLLQDKGVLEMLAEPNLTTVEGRAARFLAGGEFPYPVIQGSNGGFTSVTIQFRPYGVRLEFTPYVHPDGSIRLRVSPEVSALDYSNAVKISGYTIPALSTRKADTEVELQNGQSFAISGLLDHRITDDFSKIPGIGDIPVLGQLFRSRNLNHAVNELIVIVTPRLVEPLQQPLAQQPAVPDWAIPFMQPQQFDKGLPGTKNVTSTQPPADKQP